MPKRVQKKIDTLHIKNIHTPKPHHHVLVAMHPLYINMLFTSQFIDLQDNPLSLKKYICQSPEITPDGFFLRYKNER